MGTNYMTGHAKPEGLNLLNLSPLNMRQRLMDDIETEIKHARAKRPARMFLFFKRFRPSRPFSALNTLKPCFSNITESRSTIAPLSSTINIDFEEPLKVRVAGGIV